MRYVADQRRHTLRGYAVLGQITAEQAIQQAIAASGVSAGTISASNMTALAAWVAAGQLLNQQGQPAYIPGTADCSATKGGGSAGAGDLQLAGKAGSLTLTSVTTAGLVAAGPATLGISLAIAGIVGIFSTLLNHHAQAVTNEQDALCAAVPAANNYLKIISQGVASGQATPQDGIAALQSLSSDFDSAVSSIRKMSGGSCNAACMMTEGLRSIVAYMISGYQDMQAAQISAGASTALTAPTPAATSTGPQTAAPVTSGSTMTLPVASTPAATSTLATVESDLPTWWPIAAAALLGVLLVKAL